VPDLIYVLQITTDIEGDESTTAPVPFRSLKSAKKFGSASWREPGHASELPWIEDDDITTAVPVGGTVFVIYHQPVHP
jgi:hypothetical protein